LLTLKDEKSQNTSLPTNNLVISSSSQCEVNYDVVVPPFSSVSCSASIKIHQFLIPFTGDLVRHFSGGNQQIEKAKGTYYAQEHQTKSEVSYSNPKPHNGFHRMIIDHSQMGPIHLGTVIKSPVTEIHEVIKSPVTESHEEKSNEYESKVNDDDKPTIMSIPSSSSTSIVEPK